ncbi:MAG: hypothetical protein WKF96_07885 [Solirubrobacteraceae bacterium]
MADQIILTKLDEDADRILDAFEEQTGLHGDDEGDRRRFDVAGAGHAVDVVQTLTDIDEDWTEHVGVADPQD